MQNSFSKIIISTIGVAIFISGCAEVQFVSQATKEITPTSTKTVGPEAGNGSHYKVGNAYQIKGKWYYPRVDYSYVETGVASWYGPNFHGKQTANGAIFDMNKVSGAHKTLPLPSMVLVTNLDNGRALKVKVNDRGPYAHNRIIDLSKRAAELLGFKQQGTALVKVELLEAESRQLAEVLQNGGLYKDQPPAPDAAPTVSVDAETLAPPPGVEESTPTSDNHVVEVAEAPTQDDITRKVTTQDLSSDETYKVVKLEGAAPEIFIQAGAFSEFQNATKTKALLSTIAPVRIEQINKGDRPLFRVRVGPIAAVEQADKLLTAINNAGYPDAQIIVD